MSIIDAIVTIRFRVKNAYDDVVDKAETGKDFEECVRDWLEDNEIIGIHLSDDANTAYPYEIISIEAPNDQA